MNGYTNYVIGIEENGKYFAFVERVNNSNNIMCFFEKWKKQGAIHVNVVKTATEAHKIAAAWNETYRANGEYLYS